MFIYLKENPVLVQQYLTKYGMPPVSKVVTDHSLLFAAMENGQEEIVKLMLSKGCSVSEFSGDTPLHAAIRLRNINMVRLLLQYKAPIEATIGNGQTPLHYAVMSRQKGIILLLLQHGANSQAIDGFGRTLLHLAIEDNTDCWAQNVPPLHQHQKSLTKPVSVKSGTSQEMMELLHIFFAKGIPVDSKTNSGQTPLHFAVKRQNKKLVQFLIDRHADIHMADNDGNLPLHIAVMNDMQSSNESSDPDHSYAINKGENVASGKEKEKEKVKFIEWLLSLGADCDLENNNHETPLLLAMKTNQTLVIKSLLNYSINSNICSEDGRSIFHILLENCGNENSFEDQNAYETIKVLLDRGANPNHTDKKGRTPLGLAMKKKQNNMIELLLPHSSDFGVRDEDGNSLLHLIATAPSANQHAERFQDLVKNLCINKIDVNVKNNKNLTPLQCAVQHKLNRLAAFFMEHGADVRIVTDDGENLLHLMNTTVCTKDKDDEKALIKLLIDNGCQIDGITKKGLTPLHLASCECVAEALIEHGANVHIREKKELKTPLHLAAEKNRKAVVEMLLKAGADANTRQLDGKAALHLAVQHQNIKILSNLLTHGADIESRDDNGRTPLHEACSHGKIKCIEYLLGFGADINSIDVTNNSPLQYVSKDVKEIRSRILYHIAKLDAAGLYVNVQNFDRLNRVKSQLAEFYTRCSGEVSMLKDALVDQNKSIFDVLHMDLDELAKFKKNAFFRNILLDVDFKAKYPIYEDLIIACYKKGIVRSGLVEIAQESLKQLTRNDLPGSCIKSIFKYLKNEHLRALVEADSLKITTSKIQTTLVSPPKRLKID
ncbi:hypothetical protein QAD02_019901 [Eretmocerus hayati]|uniref:Uncharacterized protein n=1 Tax=Eretmocerus hayati TaxID=131215 RepID=A0ACC2PND9_9HYME|nr:hypothetical protein QAD02_019901 [Eretmocerus hayati]